MATMTTTLTLTDFLLARVAEDEAHWRAGEEARDCQECATLSDSEPGPTVDQMLAECEAKRQIVGLHAARFWPQWREAGVHRSSCRIPVAPITPKAAGVEEMVEWPCATIRALAVPYADHPDYRSEW